MSALAAHFIEEIKGLAHRGLTPGLTAYWLDLMWHKGQKSVCALVSAIVNEARTL